MNAHEVKQRAKMDAVARAIDKLLAEEFGERQGFTLFVFDGTTCRHVTNAGRVESLRAMMHWTSSLPDATLEEAAALEGIDWLTETLLGGEN